MANGCASRKQYLGVDTDFDLPQNRVNQLECSLVTDLMTGAVLCKRLWTVA